MMLYALHQLPHLLPLRVVYLVHPPHRPVIQEEPLLRRNMPKSQTFIRLKGHEHILYFGYHWVDGKLK